MNQPTLGAEQRLTLNPVFPHSVGDPVPPDGDQLLSLPMLLLQDQPSEPALHVRPPQLPAAEQRHWPRSEHRGLSASLASSYSGLFGVVEANQLA